MNTHEQTGEQLRPLNLLTVWDGVTHQRILLCGDTLSTLYFAPAERRSQQSHYRLTAEAVRSGRPGDGISASLIRIICDHQHSDYYAPDGCGRFDAEQGIELALPVHVWEALAAYYGVTQ